MTSGPVSASEAISNRGGCIWLTGLSGAGKTTLAESLRDSLLLGGRRVQVLDGDTLRSVLSPDLGYSKAERDIHVLRVGYISALLAQHGVLVVASLISPFEDVRERIREMHSTQGIPFYLVYLDASLAQCSQRDPKGFYEQASRKPLENFTGLTQPYELPSRPDLVLATGSSPVENSILQLIRFTKDKGLI